MPLTRALSCSISCSCTASSLTVARTCRALSAPISAGHEFAADDQRPFLIPARQCVTQLVGLVALIVGGRLAPRRSRDELFVLLARALRLGHSCLGHREQLS